MNQRNSLKNNTEAVSLQLKMPDIEIPRSIRFPKKLWDAIDADAKRCRRSSVKQLEAVLMVYYDLEETTIDVGRIGEMRQISGIETPKEKMNREQALEKLRAKSVTEYDLPSGGTAKTDSDAPNNKTNQEVKQGRHKTRKNR